MRELVTFPAVVNEYAARCTAALVVALAVVTIVAPEPFNAILAGLVFVGFVLRVAGGPRYSPLGRLSVHVLAPLVSTQPKMVSGAPKRFAQGIGAVMSAIAFGLLLADLTTAAQGVLAMLIAAAFAEAALGFCLGCWMYAQLQRRGLVADNTCVECTDIWSRPGMAAK